VEDPPEPSGGPEQEAIEGRARLFRLVDKLPTEQRRVVFERFVEQRSIREIAQQLGKSEGAVKQLQFRALEKLRSQMEGAHA
jgi:RNA polymerase sigma-70 factor, ECF subfamily